MKKYTSLKSNKYEDQEVIYNKATQGITWSNMKFKKVE